jgi:hypothetical protein
VGAHGNTAARSQREVRCACKNLLLRPNRLRDPGAQLTDDTASRTGLPIGKHIEFKIGDRHVTNLHATSTRTTRTTRKALPTALPTALPMAPPRRVRS